MRQALDTLWYTRSPHPSPLGLAAQLGWFIEEFHADGIKVFTLQESEDPWLRDSHLTHHLSNSIRQGGNVPAIWARARGARTRVIGLNWIDEFQGIVALPGAGIAQPAQLRGRRLALPVYGRVIESRRAEALHGFATALALAGLTPGDSEFVDIAVEYALKPPPPFGEYRAQLAALLRGEVDAVYVKGARGLQAAHAAGAQVLLDICSHPDPLARVHSGAPRPITVDQALLDTHPEIVHRFLARIVAAGAWATRHPDETLAYVAREMRTDAQWARQAYGPELHLRQHTDLSELSIAALEAQQRFLLEWGFIEQAFDTRAWIEPGPLATVADGAAYLAGVSGRC